MPRSSPDRRTPSEGPRRRRRRSLLWRWRRFLFLVAVVLVAGLAGAGWVLSQVELPPEEPLVETSYVCAADVTEGCGPDNAIASLSGVEDRISVRYEDLPEVLVQAVVATEDRNFFDHRGVDVVSIGRALWTDIRYRTIAQGGSTITQQYVKNAFLTDEQTLVRKLREAVMAIELERQLSKEEILERYLNTIYLGRGAYGVEAASRAYFGVSVTELDAARASYLAGLIRAPETADASRDPAEAERRRGVTLDRMVADGYLTAAEAEQIRAVPVADLVLPRADREVLGRVVGAEYGTEYFIDAVRQQLIDEFGAAAVYGGGLRVYTTLDLDLQRAAFETVTSTLDQPDDPAAALVSLDAEGRVRAMVGGTDFRTSQVNLALGVDGGGSGRGPGSAYKPFALARALLDGIDLGTRYPAPSTAVFPGADDGRDWRVTGGGSPTGEWNLVDATRVSSNTVYAQLMLDLGAPRVNELAAELGVTADVPDVPSVVLGSGAVSVLDMASSYATFMNRGVAHEPVMVIRVTDAEGRVLLRSEPDGERVLAPDVADRVTYALQQVVRAGTGTRAAVPGVEVAGKTGTTTDNRDAWFVGYSCDVAAAVWMGYPTPDADGNPRFMTDVRGVEVTGGTFPAQMWGEFMVAATAGSAPCSFPSVDVDLDVPTTTTTLRCPVDATDTTDPGTPIELCPPLTTVDDTTTTSEADGDTTTTSAPDGATTTTTGDGGGDTTTSTTTPSPTSATTTTTQPPPDDPPPDDG